MRTPSILRCLAGCLLLLAGFGTDSASAQGESEMSCSLTMPEEAGNYLILDEAARLPASLIGIHAAESLIKLNRTSDLEPHYLAQVQDEAGAYQIGVWRVLAQLNEGAERDAWHARLRTTLLNESSGFRIHAIESLAKLRAPKTPDEVIAVNQIADAADHPGSPFALWRRAQWETDHSSVEILEKQLDSEQEVIRFRAAYALWHLQPLPDAIQKTLIKKSNDSGLPESLRLMCALAGQNRQVWEKHIDSTIPSNRYFIALELARHSDPHACLLARQLLKDPDTDVRAAAAYARLKQQHDRQ